jgi:hypothetical protein
MEQESSQSDELKKNHSQRSRWVRLGALGLLAIALILVGVSQFVEDEPDDPGLIFVIPYGSAQRVPAGQLSAVDVPTNIVFKQGETAKITVINNDTVTHLAGPFLVGPGQTFVQTFPSPGVYPINCTVNDDESIVVTVEE